jgi:hypothetical protein
LWFPKEGWYWWEDLQLFEEFSSTLAIVLEGGDCSAFPLAGGSFPELCLSLRRRERKLKCFQIKI